MLFNSIEFIFLFLPISLFGYFLINRLFGKKGGMIYIGLTSLFFYGWWNPLYLGLIIPLLIVNFWLGKIQTRYYSKYLRGHQGLMIGSLLFNLGVLGYYKYLNFFVDNLNVLTQSHWVIEKCVLPLGISFFTFQKVGYLMDCYHGKSENYDFVDFSCFVLFFPQLIAGPIVHHAQIIPQFRANNSNFNGRNFAMGLTIFSIGLFKKVGIADPLSLVAQGVFNFVDGGGNPSMTLAWQGALAYTLQLYFDFSGYSDMAIGVGWMFNIQLPVNFNSPYQSRSIVDFWRRWHMTLSQFLRDYLYIPLGGNRCAAWKQKLNLLITMVLGGLWHGAAWTFVLWGALHGVFLIINHLWSEGTKSFKWKNNVLYQGAAWGITFLAVMVAWIYFRAPSVHCGNVMIQGLAGSYGVLSTAGGEGIPTKNKMILFGLVVALFLPNTQRIVQATEYFIPMKLQKTWIEWEPNIVWAIGVGLLIAWAILHLSSASEFIYFQF